MALFRTIGPAIEPISVAEAKADLRIDHDSEDELIAGLIRAAREEVETATGMALMAQSWRLTLDRWPRGEHVLLRLHPVMAVTSVTLYGREGEAEVLDPGTYVLDERSRPARLAFARRPAPVAGMNGIEIDFSAGFGEDAEGVPDQLKRAILLLVAHWFEFRASFGAADQPVSFPPGFERLIGGFRRARL